MKPAPATTRVFFFGGPLRPADTVPRMPPESAQIGAIGFVRRENTDAGINYFSRHPEPDGESIRAVRRADRIASHARCARRMRKKTAEKKRFRKTRSLRAPDSPRTVGDDRRLRVRIGRAVVLQQTLK